MTLEGVRAEKSLPESNLTLPGANRNRRQQDPTF